eukprot:515184_1
MGCCRSRPTHRKPKPDYSKEETRKLPLPKYLIPYKIDPVDDGKDTFMIFIKGQFGRTIEVRGLNDDTKISEVKLNIEVNYGIPPSKLKMGGLIDTGRPNTKEEEIGLKNGTLRFPKDLTLKQLNIKPNDVIFWTSFHDEYIKKIIMDDLTKKDVNNDINIHNAENCLFDDTKYNYDNVIKLDNLRNENSDNMQQETLKTLGICLEKRGFCLVEYPNDIQNIIDSVSINIQNAMNEIDLNEQKENENNGEWKKILHEYGYFYHENYKHSLRILTGKALEKYVSEYPKIIQSDIENISKCMDELCAEIINLGFESEYLWKHIDRLTMNETITLMDKDMKCGMIDFVKYLNVNNYEESEYLMIRKNKMNVCSHTDPGLFSLSFVSTNDGLELFDIIEKKWFKVPLNCGVLFAGETMPYVTDGRLKSGIHRVRFNENNISRFTGWYEVCGKHQIRYDVKEKAFD